MGGEVCIDCIAQYEFSIQILSIVRYGAIAYLINIHINPLVALYSHFGSTRHKYPYTYLTHTHKSNIRNTHTKLFSSYICNSYMYIIIVAQSQISSTCALYFIDVFAYRVPGIISYALWDANMDMDMDIPT